jgi:hypothetical protein
MIPTAATPSPAASANLFKLLLTPLPLASVTYKFQSRVLFPGDGIIDAGSWTDLPGRVRAIAASEIAGHLSGHLVREAFMNVLLI